MELNIDRYNDTQVAIVEERMRRRQSHLLGEQDALRDTIIVDAVLLKRLGVHHADLAKALDELMSHPERHTDITMHPLEHPLECPFELGTVYLHSNQEFLVRFNDETIRFSGLMLHLIAAHQFFGGRHSPHRLEPSKAIRLMQRSNTDLAQHESYPSMT
jgi:hypothetical protein